MLMGVIGPQGGMEEGPKVWPYMGAQPKCASIRMKFTQNVGRVERMIWGKNFWNRMRGRVGPHRPIFLTYMVSTLKCEAILMKFTQNVGPAEKIMWGKNFWNWMRGRVGPHRPIFLT